MSISDCPPVATSWCWGLDHHADLLQGQHHFAADILLAVRWRNREIAFLVADLYIQLLGFSTRPAFQRPSTESCGSTLRAHSGQSGCRQR